MTEVRASAGRNEMTYGGNGGSFSPLQDTGGQYVIIKAGSKIDSIQIGGTRYGGGGGSEKASFKLPADGVFTILHLCAHDDEISYIKLICDGQTYSAGQIRENGDLTFGSGLRVTFAGISSGSMVDKIWFNIVE